MRTTEYHDALAQFVKRLEEDQNRGRTARGITNLPPIRVVVEQGRKFDRIVIVNESHSTRYFVAIADGTIHGAKSWRMPNFRWFFGTIYTAELWDWSDFHAIPINDPSVRAVRRYGPYIQYIRV